MIKFKAQMAFSIFVFLFFAGNLWAADGAMIIAFTPPTGQLARDQQATASVTIRNTGDTTRSFWVGLSFAHETAAGDGWPEGWYDIKPLQTNSLAPGEEATVNFYFIVFKTLRYGQYYAVTSVWDNYNPNTYLMDNRLDSTLWHSEKPEWQTNPDLGMRSFSLSVLNAIPQDFLTQINDWLKFVGLSYINSAYNYGLKPLLTLSYSQTIISTPLHIPALNAGGAMFIDYQIYAE